MFVQQLYSGPIIFLTKVPCPLASDIDMLKAAHRHERAHQFRLSEGAPVEPSVEAEMRGADFPAQSTIWLPVHAD